MHTVARTVHMLSSVQSLLSDIHLYSWCMTQHITGYHVRLKYVSDTILVKTEQRQPAATLGTL